MHQDVAILADTRLLKELQASLDTGRQWLCGIVGHRKPAVVKALVLLKIVHHAAVCTGHCAIEDVPDIELFQAVKLLCIVGIANVNPV